MTFCLQYRWFTVCVSAFQLFSTDQTHAHLFLFVLSLGVNVTAAHLNTTIHNLCTACFSNYSHFCLTALILASNSLLLAWFCTLHVISLRPNVSCINQWPILAPIRIPYISKRKQRLPGGETESVSLMLSFTATPRLPIFLLLACRPLKTKVALFPEGGFISAASWRTRSNMDVNKPNESCANCDWLVCCAAASWNAGWAAWGGWWWDIIASKSDLQLAPTPVGSQSGNVFWCCTLSR